MKISFIRAWWGSCSGTDIFVQLRTQSLLRAVFHLVLMSLISALVIGIGVYPGLQRKVDFSINEISKNCGTLIISKNGIVPEKSPDLLRMFVVSGPVAVTYLPDNCKLPENFHQDCNMGIIFNGKRAGMWVLQGHDLYDFVPMSGSLKAVKQRNISGVDAMEKVFRTAPEVSLDIPEGVEESFTAGKMRATVLLMLPIILGIMLLHQTLFEVIIYILMFTGVTLLMNLSRPNHMKLRDLVVLAIYAGFPAMTAGSIAGALQLPVLSFNIIYVLGMTVYLIIIMNKLERLRQEQQWRQEQQ